MSGRLTRFVEGERASTVTLGVGWRRSGDALVCRVDTLQEVTGGDLISGKAPHSRSWSRRELLVLCVLTGIMAATFVVLTADVWHANRQVALDRVAAEVGIVPGEEGPLGGDRRRAEAAGHLGSRRGVGLATLALVGLAMFWREWVTALVALLAPLVCFVIIEYVGKPAINEPIPFGGRAYPSGHGAGVTAVAVSGLVLLYRRWGGPVAILFAPVAVAAVTTGGLGVLALGLHHYPTDVVGGAVLASTVVLSLTVVLSWATDILLTSGRLNIGERP